MTNQNAQSHVASKLKRHKHKENAMNIKEIDTVFYPVKFTQQEDGSYIGTFRDVPEAVPQCDTIEDIQEMAGFVLNLYFEHYREHNKAIPEPSQAQEGETLIEITRYELP